MLAPFADQPSTAAILEAAHVQLGTSAFDFLAHAGDEELSTNRNSQILCVTRSLAATTSLGALPPDTIVTGYSIGELSAWGVAGVWLPKVTVELAAQRAEAMDRAGGDHGLLGYVRGLSQAAVQALCDDHHCFIAIRNPDRLFVVGGHERDVRALCDAAPERGAMRAATMNVHVASHTPYLTEAVQPFEDALRHPEHQKPRLRLMSTARSSLVTSPSRAIPDLALQIARPIDWEATLIALQERGVRRLLELGPGSALSEMAAQFSADWKARSFDDFETAAGAREWLARPAR